MSKRIEIWRRKLTNWWIWPGWWSIRRTWLMDLRRLHYCCFVFVERPKASFDGVAATIATGIPLCHCLDVKSNKNLVSDYEINNFTDTTNYISSIAVIIHFIGILQQHKYWKLFDHYDDNHQRINIRHKFEFFQHLYQYCCREKCYPYLKRCTYKLRVRNVNIKIIISTGHQNLLVYFQCIFRILFVRQRL